MSEGLGVCGDLLGTLRTDAGGLIDLVGTLRSGAGDGSVGGGGGGRVC